MRKIHAPASGCITSCGGADAGCPLEPVWQSWLQTLPAKGFFVLYVLSREYDAMLLGVAEAVGNSPSE